MSVIIALDLEWYDQTGGRHLTEIGAAIKYNNGVNEYYHFIVEEHRHLENRYCPTSPVGFQFGVSKVLSLRQIKSYLVHWFHNTSSNLVVVFHNGTHDIRILNEVFSLNVRNLATTVADTGKMMGGKGLEASLAQMQVSYDKLELHNAGNDAVYTLMLYQKLLLREKERKQEQNKTFKSARVNLSTFSTISTGQIFASGGFKNVYLGQYTNGPRKGEKCVCKLFKTGGAIESSYFDKELQIVAKAMEIVEAFNDLNVTKNMIYLNQPDIWEFTRDSGDWAGKKNLVEPYINNFEKFNSNTGWKSSSRSHWNQVIQALTHFSFHHSGGIAVLCDLQGGIANGCLYLSDPVIMSPDQRFGPTDLGNTGISTFFSQHRCNMFCRPAEWKVPVDQNAYYAPKKGSSMINPKFRKPAKKLPSMLSIQE